MEDYIVRASAAGGMARGFAASSRNTVETARKNHGTTPVATAALGRLMTAAAIMGGTLKNEKDLITLQIKCSGPIQGIVATSDSHSRVKGYVFNPNAPSTEKYPGKLDVGTAVGKGSLSVVKDIGLKEPYSGQTELVSGEIAEDLTYYFAVSEQTPSIVGLGVMIETDGSVRHSGGFIVQLMPEASENVIKQLEENAAALPSVTELFEQGKSPEEIMEMVLRNLDMAVTNKIPMEFHCGCSRQRVEKALISIGRDELKKIIREDQKADLKCHFCNKEYHFDKSQLEQIYNEALER